jgi:hypothetical protein
MSLTLDELIDSCHAHARRVLIGSATEQIQPLFHIQFKNRPDAVMPAPFSDEQQKSAFLAALRLALREFRNDVVNYATISEAWAAQYDHEPRAGDLMPSERETRKEIVIVSAGDHKGARVKAWEIIRDDKGRVTDLIEDKGMADNFEGRMFNLMQDED